MFLDLLASMIHWTPECRKSAKELLEHEFFDDIREDWHKGDPEMDEEWYPGRKIQDWEPERCGKGDSGPAR